MADGSSATRPIALAPIPHDSVSSLDSERLTVNRADALALVCARFATDPAQLGDSEALLVRYYTAYHLNIEWYDKRILRCEHDQLRNDTLMRVVGFTALLAIVGASVLAAIFNHDAGVTGAQLSFGVAGLVAALQLGATGKDYRAQRGAFWKARAALKNRLFAFEDAWLGRVLDGSGQPQSDFRTGLALEIRAAHDIEDQERQEYFDTFKTPSELSAIVQSVLPGLTAPAPGILQAREARLASATSGPIVQAQKSVRDAEASVRVAEALLAELGPGVDESERKAAQIALAHARADRAGAEYQLQEAIKGSRP